MRKSYAAFTLVELLVVVSIIVVLIAILIPSMENAMDVAQKAKCAANQHSAVTGTILYTQQNKGEFFACRGRQVIISFDGQQGAYSRHSGGAYERPEDRTMNWASTLASAGMAGQSGTAVQPIYTPYKNLWCPTYLATFPDANGNLVTYNEPIAAVGASLIGYQYMGGVEWWLNPDKPSGKNLESSSPVNMTKSRGGWVVTGDLIFQSGVQWLPIHTVGNPNNRPEGGNFSYVDGSVAWFKVEDTRFLHSWAVNGQRNFFIAQRDAGYAATDRVNATSFY